MLKKNSLINIYSELDSQLNFIYSSSQIMGMNVESDENFQDDYYLSVIKKNCNMLLKINNSILEYTKLQKGIVNINLQSVAIKEFFDEFAKHVMELIDVKIDVVINCKCSSILTDSKLLEKTFLQLVSNAVFYNVKSVKKIWINITDDDKGCKISFRDNGIGLDSMYYKDVFDEYTIICDENSGDGEKVFRVGLGLTLCRGYINLLRGSIKVTSKADRGCTFTITLPQNVNYNANKISDINRANLFDDRAMEVEFFLLDKMEKRGRKSKT